MNIHADNQTRIQQGDMIRTSASASSVKINSQDNNNYYYSCKFIDNNLINSEYTPASLIARLQVKLTVQAQQTKNRQAGHRRVNASVADAASNLARAC